MTAGMLPAVRSLRAAPLPTVSRNCAARLAVAIGRILTDGGARRGYPVIRRPGGAPIDNYSNNELTLWSAWVNRMAFASSSPTLSTQSCSNFLDSGSAIELVTATSLIGADESRCTAGPESNGCVAHT